MYLMDDFHFTLSKTGQISRTALFRTYFRRVSCQEITGDPTASVSLACRRWINIKSIFAQMVSLPRRIIKETQRLLQEPVPGISAVPDDSNARYFHVIVTGPDDSPFEGGLFKLELFLPEDYPMSAPKVIICISTEFIKWILSKFCSIDHLLLGP